VYDKFGKKMYNYGYFFFLGKLILTTYKAIEYNIHGYFWSIPVASIAKW